MHRGAYRLVLLIGGSVLLAGATSEATRVRATLSKHTATRLEKFESAKQFDEYVGAVSQVQPPPSWAFGCGASAPSMAAKSAETAPSESITNNQEQGVDEGDIVKSADDFLVILRRGRLFSVRVGAVDAPELTPVSQVNAWPDGYTKGTWYDELLVSKDPSGLSHRVIVVGFSYQVSATEIGLFRLSADGQLTHEGHFFLRSNDYYSSRNYASRLVGTKLVFYMPYALWQNGGSSLPAMQRWQRGNDLGKWSDILQKTEAYRPLQLTSSPMLHTVVTCELAATEPACAARSIVGPYSRSFYVSRDAIYLWVSPGYEWSDPKQDQRESVVYRLPIDDSEVTAVRARGAPIDQFSFQERDGQLNVALTDATGGDAMWHPEVAKGDLVLARIPLTSFAVEPAALEADRYTRLGDPGSPWSTQNRFVGGWLLFGTGQGWHSSPGASNRGAVHVVSTADPSVVHEVQLEHLVDRLEPLGLESAAVIGPGNGGLGYSVLALGGTPRVASRYTEAGATQGETRSHGFFFKPDGAGGGVLGLPVRLQGGAWQHLQYGSAKVSFLRVSDSLDELTQLGELAANDTSSTEDSCKYSCVDWYGNARPIFYRDRVFALMGYELVEGALLRRFHELRRVEYLQR